MTAFNFFAIAGMLLWAVVIYGANVYKEYDNQPPIIIIGFLLLILCYAGMLMSAITGLFT